jgi:hypothetical protein
MSRDRAAAAVALAFIAAVLGLCFAGLVAIVLATPARAGELSREQVAVVYAIAYSHVGGALPEQAPRVHLVDRTVLQGLACAWRSCPARGAQVGADIFVDESLDFSDPADASVLLHELVHFLQFARWGPARDCHENIRREREAYTIQAHELERLGKPSSSVLITARSLGCS